jgi:predicted SAM-dependent methyltransferase
LSESPTIFVNVGCGPRFVAAPRIWKNFDFSSDNSAVQQCNLLAGLPLPDGVADFAYSSHMLEHFSLAQAQRLLREIRRVLKPLGRVRIVVPDLEDVCANYLTSLNLRRSGGRRFPHRWATIELLDQMVREKPGGLMARVHREVAATNNQEMRELIRRRTGFDVLTLQPPSKRDLQYFRRVSVQKVKSKLAHLYIRAVAHLLPSSLREMVMDQSMPGEKHKWMYDREALADLLSECGFGQIEFLSADRSGELSFLNNNLDLNPDGSAYKRSSIYVEALK